jgi:hypothetical protein
MDRGVTRRELFSTVAASALAQTPALGGFFPSAAGKISGVSGNNVLITGDQGSIVGAAWNQANMIGGQGRIVALPHRGMDGR